VCVHQLVTPLRQCGAVQHFLLKNPFNVLVAAVVLGLLGSPQQQVERSRDQCKECIDKGDSSRASPVPLQGSKELWSANPNPSDRAIASTQSRLSPLSSTIRPSRAAEPLARWSQRCRTSPDTSRSGVEPVEHTQRSVEPGCGES
jgi:hypothetical protein